MMFCPACRVEYRPGFTQCADCGAELVPMLPPKQPDPNFDPTEYPSKEFFFGFIPLACVAAGLSIFLVDRMHISGFHPLIAVLVFVHIVVPLGGWWLIYQAIRYEIRVWRYVLLAFVPFGFLWYLFVRYPHRPKLVRVPRETQPTE